MSGASRADRVRFYNELASARARNVARWRGYYDAIARLFSGFIADDARVLEIGCGIGQMIARVRGISRMGIDCAPVMIEEAARRTPSDVEFHVADITEEQPHRTFDVIFMVDTINMLSDVEKALHTIRSSYCHERTRLIVTFHSIFWKPFLSLAGTLGLKTNVGGQNWLSSHDVRSLLVLTNFEVVRADRLVLLPLHLPLITWFFNEVIAHLPLISLFCISRSIVARPIGFPVTEQSVSIIIPVRNEAGNIHRALEEMPTFGSSQEILFIEGHSSDDTWASVQKLQAEYRGPHRIITLQQTGKGKANAVREGFAKATGDILMILDGDLTVPAKELPKFYRALVSGKGECINGTRLVYPMDDKAMRPLNYVGNRCFSVIMSCILRQPVTDTLCGTKVFLRSDYKKIVDIAPDIIAIDPFGDFEMLIGASRLPLKILEIPIRYKERTYGQTNIRRFRDGWKLIKIVLLSAVRSFTYRNAR